MKSLIFFLETIVFDPFTNILAPFPVGSDCFAYSQCIYLNLNVLDRVKIQLVAPRIHKRNRIMRDNL